jgi:ketosteroid isomerase-like protein
MRQKVRTQLVILLLLVGARVTAQQPATPQPSPDQLQRAATLFSQGNWSGAFAEYSAISRAFPSHALSRFRIGVSQMELKQLDEAEKNIREGERLGVPAGQSAFRLAQVFAERGNGEKAIAELMRAASSGMFIGPSALSADRHLALVTGHPKWASVVDAFDAVVRPCMHDARFREFDFWLGEWDVRPTGQPAAGPAARNTVTLDDNGCVVTEHWVAPGGSEGQSFNIFDRSMGQWRQTWVDNVGGQHDYRGTLKGGNMVYLGDTPAPNGQAGRIPTRLTFVHIGPDSVRQFSEQSSDSGRSWQVAYDLMYVRRKVPSVAPMAAPLSLGDIAAIRALDSVFVQGWLRDDTSAVLGVFAHDAALLPPGSAPVVGVDAIRAYWWPRDGSRTQIRSFKRDIAEIEGTSAMAFIRGTATLAWAYTKDGKTTEQTGRSNDMIVVARDASGQWRIVRQVWNTVP